MADTRTPSLLRDRLLFAIISVSLWVLLAMFTRAFVGEMYGARVDFTPRWVGAQAFWSKTNPYASEVTDRIQVAMFGSRLPPGEDEQRFAHPAYTAVLIGPFLWLPQDAAIAFWSALQLVLLISVPILWMNMLEGVPPRWFFLFIIVTYLILFRYPMIVYVLGQFVGTILFGFTLSLWLLRRGYAAAAGAALVLCMMPPTLGVFLVGLVLLPEMLRGRWRTTLSFVTIMGAITLFTFVQIGWWIPDWISGLSAYTDYAQPYFPLGLLPLWAQILLSGAVLLAVWMAMRNWYRSDSDAYWWNLISVGVLAITLLVPQTGSYYLTCLVVVVITAVEQIAQSDGGWKRAAVVWLGFAASPWLWFLLPDGGRTEVLFVPLLAAILWVWSRSRARPLLSSVGT